MKIDWWTLGLQAVNFAVLVYVLRRFLYAPVQKVIAARKALAEAAMTAAGVAKAAAEAEQARLVAAQAALEADRAGVLAAAAAEAEAARKATVATARAEADGLLAKAQGAIAAERDAAIAAAQGDLAALAAGLAGRILQQTAASVAPGVFLDAIAARIEALPEVERARLQADLPGGVTVVTAQPLPEGERVRWTARLLAALGGEGAVAFTEEAAIIGGAELRFAHAALKFGWADRLLAAQKVLQGHDGTE